ncbi:MAG: T9SS type A sorting domain-containing protein [Chitinophagales bacterium]|nr:T9SS type A sorting domain-containing protein [Chitinophagales bacterium]
MKKIHLPSFFVLLMFLSGLTSNAQGIDSFHVYPICSPIGDTAKISYQFAVNPLTSSTSIVIYYGDGSSSTFSPSSSLIYGSHPYSSEGVYTIKAIAYNGTTPMDSAITTTSIYCSEATINIYDDINTNCTKGITEPLIANMTKIEVKENGVVIDTLSVFGYGTCPVKKNTSYVFKILNTPLGTSATCPSTRQYSFTTSSSTSTYNLSFGVQRGTTPQHDLSVNAFGRFRPVSWSVINIWAINNQIYSNQAGTITLNISPKYSYSHANVTPTSISGNTITWNVPATKLNKYHYGIMVYLKPATTITVGDTVCNTVSISPNSGDINIFNNTVYRCNTVVSSFDPNEKSVYPQGNFKQGDVFTYRIDFENLGNDTAFNIHVLDTLSTYLNENSIEILNTSHAMSYNILTAGMQKILKFEFPDINLPDSNSKQYNKGFVEFKIRTKIGIPAGTTLSNRAGIYFDINPVVMTNSANRTLAPVSVNEIHIGDEVIVYPNPANDILNISMTEDYYQHAYVLNSMGQELKVTSVTKGNNILNIKQLPTGIYQLLLKGEYGTKVIKFQKL